MKKLKARRKHPRYRVDGMCKKALSQLESRSRTKKKDAILWSAMVIGVILMALSITQYLRVVNPSAGFGLLCYVVGLLGLCFAVSGGMVMYVTYRLPEPVHDLLSETLNYARQHDSETRRLSIARSTEQLKPPEITHLEELLQKNAEEWLPIAKFVLNFRIGRPIHPDETSTINTHRDKLAALHARLSEPRPDCPLVEGLKLVSSN